MAVTFTVTKQKVYKSGDRKEVVADISCTGTPTVGGDALTGATLGLEDELDYVAPVGNASNSGGTSGAVVAAVYSGATPTSVPIVFYVQGTAGAANAMVALAASTAGLSFRVVARGKGSAEA